MTVPEEVQAMHLRHFDAYISALVTRLTQTDEHYNFITLCERIERLLSIGTEFYESREEPSVVETTPIISPPADTFETPEEEPLKATPTMSAEELRAWEAAQTTPQPERKRPVWSQEARDAAAERARNRNKKRVPEEAPALASTAPSLPESSAVVPSTPLAAPPAGDLTPEDAAHEDAAIILAELEPDPLPTREPITIGNRPDCACPDGWLKPWESWMATDRALTHRHHIDCPLHRHKHRFGVAPDGDGNLLGRCECGNTEYRPVEPERVMSKKPAAVAS